MKTQKTPLILFIANIVVLVIVVVGGFKLSQWHSATVADKIKSNLLQQATDIAKALNPVRVKQLTFTAADTASPVFQRLQNQLLSSKEIFRYKGIYTMKLFDGEFRFGPETYEPGSPMASPPGTVYESPTDFDYNVYRNIKPDVDGPITDEYGSFISALAPVTDPRTGEVLMLVGVDIPADDYYAELRESKKLPHLLTLLTMILISFGFANLILKKVVKKYARSYFITFETILIGLSFLFIAALITIKTALDEKLEIEKTFQVLAKTNNYTISDELVGLRNYLYNFTKYVQNQELLKHNEFDAMLSSLTESSSAIAYMWIPNVKNAHRSEFEKWIQEDGIPGFCINENDLKGNRVKALERPDYFPITYIHPAGVAEELLGFDISTGEDVRNALSEVIRDRLIFSTSFSYQLKNGETKNYYILLSPVTNTIGSSVLPGKKLNPDELLGVFAMIVDFDNMLQVNLQKQYMTREYIHTCVYDITSADQQKLISSYPIGSKSDVLDKEDLKSAISYITPTFAVGRFFAVISYPNEKFISSNTFRNSYITGISGAIVALILTITTWFWRNRQHLLDNTVKQKTLELSERIKEINSLHKISGFFQQKISPAEICSQTAEILCQGMQYPESATVTVLINGQSYTAGIGVINLNNEISAVLKVFGRPIGKLSVSYQNDELILEEEKRMIEQAGIMLSKHFEQLETEELRQKAILDMQRNEASLKFAQQIAKMGSWEFLTENRKISWSENNYRLLGFEPGEVDPSPELFKMMVHPEDRHKLTENYQQSEIDDKAVKDEIRFFKKDGSLIWLEIYTVGTFKDGRQVMLRGVNIDITDRKKSEDALFESNEKFRLITEHTADTITMMNMSYQITYQSPSVINLRGFSAEEAMKQTMDEILAPDSYQKFISLLSEELSAESSGTADPNRYISMEAEQNCKDGSTVWVEMVLTFIRDSKAKPAGIVSVARDITLRKKTEEALRQAKEKAEAGDKLKTAFMNTISHEIRTPLNGILGFGQMIVQPDLTNEERNDYLDILKLSCTRLIDTVNDFMDISLIASGNLKLSLSDFDVVPLIRDVFDKLRNSALNKKLEAILELPPVQTPLILRSDLDLLTKSITHLVNNAVKFTHKGRITLGIRLNKRKLEIFVKDTGIGVSEEAKKRIFEYFGQEEMSTTRNYEGSGLGLSITHGIMKMLGGQISMESEKGVGSVFSLTMPFDANLIIPEATEISTEAPLIKSERPVILMAEDDDSNAYYLKVLLKKINAETIHVLNGIDAVDQCRSNKKITLVIMDIKMPKMNGIEATKLIKEMRSDLPVIAVTAFANTGDEKTLLAAGFDAYLPKPFNKDSVFEKIGKFIDLS